MFKDYHYLLRCVLELREELIGYNINDVFSQEKDKLYAHIPSEASPFRHLIISCDPQLSALYTRKELHKAKKNCADFFSEYLPAKIIDIRIADNDRVLNIACDNFDFFFMIRGVKTNFILLDKKSKVIPFKKLLTSEENLLADLSAYEFVNDYFEEEFIAEPQISFKSLKNKYPFVSRKLYEEFMFRTNIENRDSGKVLGKCITGMLEDKIKVGTNNDKQLFFLPESFRVNTEDDYRLFEIFDDAVQFFLSSFYKSKKFQNDYKQLQEQLDKHLSIYSNRLNNLKGRLEKGSKEDSYYKYGQLLLVNLNSIKAGSDEVYLDDYLTGKEIEIKLDPAKSIQENANYYFDKAKDEKKNYNKSSELYSSTRIKYETYSKFKKEIETSNQLDDLKFIADQLNLKQSGRSEKLEEQVNYREYIIENKYRAFVGKDSKSNDRLTVKIAKQNDYWFHARGYSGSHVVLRVDNPKEGIPKNVLNSAASLAAYYSKGKTAKVTPVSYTLRKYVRKNKNMNPGQVMLTKEKVLHVKPEIPSNTEEV